MLQSRIAELINPFALVGTVLLLRRTRRDRPEVRPLYGVHGERNPAAHEKEKIRGCSTRKAGNTSPRRSTRTWTGCRNSAGISRRCTVGRGVLEDRLREPSKPGPSCRPSVGGTRRNRYRKAEVRNQRATRGTTKTPKTTKTTKTTKTNHVVLGALCNLGVLGGSIVDSTKKGGAEAPPPAPRPNHQDHQDH